METNGSREYKVVRGILFDTIKHSYVTELHNIFTTTLPKIHRLDRLSTNGK